jgi:hypothetical protein
MKGSLKYITALRPDRWERWREDWVLVQINAHERLMLPTVAPMPPPTMSTGSRTSACSQFSTLC